MALRLFLKKVAWPLQRTSCFTFGTPYVAVTSLFAIPFAKSFKALHFTPIGLLFNLRFMGTIFLSQRTKNGLFEFTTLCLCFQKSNAWFENVWMFKF